MSSSSQTQHALYMFTRTFDRYKHESFLNLKTFSDGLPFAFMLSSIEYFVGIPEELEANAEKWTQKLANLKKLIAKMETYVETQSQKSLRINDLELVEIAKNNSQEEILKFFEVVVGVLMQTEEKQDYIQRIMGLDERSQQALVIVVQNAMQQRISQQQGANQQTRKTQSIQLLTSLQNENLILSQQIGQLTKENQSLLRHNKQLQQRMHEYQQQIQKVRNLSLQLHNNTKVNEIQRENSLVETLKKKMIELARQHEVELSKYSDQIYHLKSKLHHYKEIEDQLMERNKLLEEKMKNLSLTFEDQRKRLDKTIDDNLIKIKKLEYELEVSRNKVRQLSEDIEVNDLNLRMELERKQVRFKQLEKQVKTRLTQPSSQLGFKKPSSQQPQSPLKVQQNQEQIQYLKIQVEKLRNSSRELQRQNLKLKKKSEKIQAIENEKKKLQKIILDVSKCRDSEIQMLVVSLYDLRNQNIRMHQIITQLKYREESKYE